MFRIIDEIIQVGLDTMQDEPARNLDNHKRWAFTQNHFDRIKLHFNNLNFLSGAVFWHNEPYPLHVDVWDPRNKSQILIPLKLEKSQKFIIFDQTYDGSMTWKNNISKEVKKAEYDDAPKNTTGLRPYETEGVQGLTNKPIDSDLAKELPEESDFYFGLSGKSYDWTPGIGMAFESKTLHGTGKMDYKYYKTGMALWFSDTVEDILSCMGARK